MSFGFIKDEYKEALAQIAEAMIPGAMGMPSASQANVVEHCETVLDIQGHNRAGFSKALRTFQKMDKLTPIEKLVKLQQEDLETYTAFIKVVVGAWAISEPVRTFYKLAANYAGQISNLDYDGNEAPDFIKQGLLQPVIDRGSIYRPV